MSTSAPAPQTPDPLDLLKRRLAAFVLVALTGIAVVAAAASCTFAILGQFGDGGSPPGWLGIAAAGFAASRLLVYVYRRLLGLSDRRAIRPRLR